MNRKRLGIFKSKSPSREVPCPTVMGLCCGQAHLGVAQGKYGLGQESNSWDSTLPLAAGALATRGQSVVDTYGRQDGEPLSNLVKAANEAG